MSETVDPVIVAARFATYLLAILVFGGAAYRATIEPKVEPAKGPLVRLIAPAALAIAALAYLLLLAREVGPGAGAPDPAVVIALAASTGFGRALTVSGAAALALAALGAASGRHRWTRLALSGAALAALAFVGHPADSEGALGTLRLALMATHLLAVGAWVGALPSLIGALGFGASGASKTLRRFGRLGVVAVTLVLATGAASLALVAITAGRPLGPLYLGTLAVKLALVVGLLALAAVNRFRLTPRLARDPCHALTTLRRTIVAEQALGAAAVAAVALLGQLDPSM